MMSKNLFNQNFGGANILLDFLMGLQSIEPYIQLVHATEEGAPLKMPTSVADAHALMKSCKSLSRDYDMLSRILSMPIFEPLTEDRLSKIITIIHACLYISASLAAASSILQMSVRTSGAHAAGPTTIHREESEEGESFFVNEIVDMSLDIYKKIMALMKSSPRVGAQVCQNAHLFATWLLLSSLKYILSLNPSKFSGTRADSVASHGSSKAIRQAYSTQCIPLATHAIWTLGSLLEDLKSESGQDAAAIQRLERLTSPNPNSVFKFNKFGTYSGWQRLEMLMSSISLTNLLFSLASVSYRKAGMLRTTSSRHHQFRQLSTPGSSASSHDPIEILRTPSVPCPTSDIDEECCFSSDDSSRDDDDSEPFLGQLFRESDFIEREESGAKGGLRTPKSPTFTYEHADRRESQRHLSLAHSIFECFNIHFVCSDIQSLRSYLKNTLSEAQIVILSNIIKDFDRENCSTTSASFYQEFSRLLVSFMHNLIATEVLSEPLQTCLLTHLGVNPSPSERSYWPLYIAPRTLSIMAQVILLKQRKEKDELRSDTGAACLYIWQSLVSHLKKLVSDPTEGEKPQSRHSNSSEIAFGDYGDINVEHAQVLLFIFHNLKLLQRKSVLLMLAQTLIDVSPVINDRMRDEQIHYMGRLLHFFEYMMKHLYEPPHALVEQIDNNLFRHGLTTSRRDHDNNKPEMMVSFFNSKMYYHSRDVEDQYVKYCALNVETDRVFLQPLRPRFYHLLPVDFISTKDVPKLDGMSLNFILVGVNDVINYENVYDSLMKMLNILNQLDVLNREEEGLSYLGVF